MNMILLHLVQATEEGGWAYLPISLSIESISEVESNPEGGSSVKLRQGANLWIQESWAEVQSALTGKSMDELFEDDWEE